MKVLAEKAISLSLTVPGVQPKLSLALDTVARQSSKLTLVGLGGNFILKPQVSEYPELPENESITMRMAAHCGIPTVPQGLIALASGEFAYITRRVDRVDGVKLPMEDMCQLSERLTEDKYKGSYEQVARLIRKFSRNPGYDVLVLYESLIFCFLVGNADMHLKNYSLLTSKDTMVQLSPLYDLVATKLALPEDKEETALTFNGKKSKINKEDFLSYAKTTGILPKVAMSSIDKLLAQIDSLGDFVQKSYLSTPLKQAYLDLMDVRYSRLSHGRKG